MQQIQDASRKQAQSQFRKASSLIQVPWSSYCEVCHRPKPVCVRSQLLAKVEDLAKTKAENVEKPEKEEKPEAASALSVLNVVTYGCGSKFKRGCGIGFCLHPRGPKSWCHFFFEAQPYMAMVQNQWYHFGIGAPPMLVSFSGDVHWQKFVLCAP